MVLHVNSKRRAGDVRRMLVADLHDSRRSECLIEV